MCIVELMKYGNCLLGSSKVKGHKGKNRSSKKPHLLEKKQRSWSGSALPVIKLKATPGAAFLPTHARRIQGEKAALRMQAQLWHTEWKRECFGEKKKISLFHLSYEVVLNP